MNKQQLMVEFEKALAVLAGTVDDTPQSDWAYNDFDIQWNFLVFCEGVTRGEQNGVVPNY